MWRPTLARFIGITKLGFNGDDGRLTIIFNFQFFKLPHINEQLQNYLSMYDQFKILRCDTSLMLETNNEYSVKNTDTVRVMRVYDPDSQNRNISAKEMMKMANCRHFLMHPSRPYYFHLRPRFPVLVPQGDNTSLAYSGINRVDNPWRDTAELYQPQDANSANSIQLYFDGTKGRKLINMHTVYVLFRGLRQGQTYIISPNKRRRRDALPTDEEAADISEQD